MRAQSERVDQNKNGSPYATCASRTFCGLHTQSHLKITMHTNDTAEGDFYIISANNALSLISNVNVQTVNMKARNQTHHNCLYVKWTHFNILQPHLCAC
jgi:hypothetical protein